MPDDRLDDHLKQKLVTSIQSVISGSHLITEALENLRDAGYDIFIVLDASIGFRKHEHQEDTMSEASAPTKPLVVDGKVVPSAFTSKDGRFLDDLKIRFDKE
jgi:hypothetical protein